MNHTRETLIAFEDRVKQAFLARQIASPVHLSGGNEEDLLSIFYGNDTVRKEDWVFSTWRSHYHALLKGIPEEEVFSQILDGRSMHLMSAEHRFLCSSIVGGILPIACGVAMGAKRLKVADRVWVFVGDMTARTGLFHEFLAYCDGHDLPVQVVIEDNGFSTNTPTQEVWGQEVEYHSSRIPILHYRYVRVLPHVGVGRHVQF